MICVQYPLSYVFSLLCTITQVLEVDNTINYAVLLIL